MSRIDITDLNIREVVGNLWNALPSPSAKRLKMKATDARYHRGHGHLFFVVPNAFSLPDEINNAFLKPGSVMKIGKIYSSGPELEITIYQEGAEIFLDAFKYNQKYFEGKSAAEDIVRKIHASYFDMGAGI